MRTGKAQTDQVHADAQGRPATFNGKSPANQHLSKDGTREQSSRLGVGPSGSNHIVVGQFGDPIMMGVTSTRKNSPRSQKKSVEFKGGRRLAATQMLPGVSTPSSTSALQAQAYYHPGANGENQSKSQGIDGFGSGKTSHHQANGGMNPQKLHQKNQ